MSARIALTVLAISLSGLLRADSALASSNTRPSASDKAMAAIGHRDIGGGKGLGNWYSLDKEKEIGKNLSVEVEQSSRILSDPAIEEYVTRVAENIAKNSDAQIPITVRLLNTDHVEAFTLPGGYQYITRGLLLKLDNESELASVLARGIAHTALRTSARQMTRAQYANIGTVPLIFTGADAKLSSDAARGFALPATFLKFRRESEAMADYFAVQYVYKAGYSTDGFTQMVQKIWPDLSPKVSAFNSFPPTSDRLRSLHKEISKLMPKRGQEVLSTPQFEEFQTRLRQWQLSKRAPNPN